VGREGSNSIAPDVEDISRLPLSLQLKLAQVEYNASHPTTIPIHLALRDWMALAVCLAYDPWDAPKYERGNYRNNDDGYRNELFMRLVQQCLDAAKPFGNFTSRNAFYHDDQGTVDDQLVSSVLQQSSRKRRKLCVTPGPDDVAEEKVNATTKSGLVSFAKVIFALRALLGIEREKNFAPPPAISFGGDTGSFRGKS